MARKIKGPKPGELRKYIPEAYDNRSDPEPVTVWIRTPTERLKRALYTGEGSIRVTGDNKIETSIGDENKRQHDAVRQCIDRVENYIGANGEPITNGEELAEHGESAILFEVSGEILLALSLSDEKKSGSDESQSISSVKTDLSDGTVPNAQDLGLSKSETATATDPVLLTSYKTGD